MGTVDRQLELGSMIICLVQALGHVRVLLLRR